MKRKFLSKGNKVLALALAAALTFPMLPAGSVQAAEAGTPIYTDEAELPAGWTVSAGAVKGDNTDKGGNTSNKLALTGKAKADYKLASAVSTGHVKLEYEVFSDGVANAMVVYDSDGKALINVGGAGSGNINIMPGYADGAATGAEYATSGKVFEWVGLSKSAWRKISIDIDLDKSNKDGVLSFTLNVYEPDGDYKGADTKWKFFEVSVQDDPEKPQTRNGQFSQDAYVKPRGNNKGGNIVEAGAHANGAATPGITKFSVAGIQLVSTGEGPFYDNMVLTTGAADAGSEATPEPSTSTPAPSEATPAPSTSTPAPSASTPAPSTSTSAPSAAVSADGTYTVQRGDTLYGIARKLLGNGSKWIDLYNWNSATIKDAKLIFAGQVLQVNGASSSTGTTTPSEPAASTPAPSTPSTSEATTGEVKNLAAATVGSHDFDKQQRVLKATLTWDAVSGAASYDVYRDGTKIGTASSNTYEDTAYDVNGKVEYAVAVAGSSSKSSITVTQVGYDITLAQEQTDKDKNKVMPETAKGYIAVLAQGKNDSNASTVYEKGKTAGFSVDNQLGRWRMNECSTLGLTNSDLRGGEALTTKDSAITFKADAENGTYDVWVLTGDFDAKTQASSVITVNGESQTLVAPEKATFTEGHFTATVTDGVITIEVKGIEEHLDWGRLSAVIITSQAK